MAIGIALFVVKMMVTKGLEVKDLSKNLDWAVWLGVGGALSALLASILFTCAGCGANYEGYYRGDV